MYWKFIETSAICNNMLITKKDYIYECEDYRHRLDDVGHTSRFADLGRRSTLYEKKNDKSSHLKTDFC